MFKRLVLAVGVFVIFAAGAFAAFQVADIGESNAPTGNQTQINETIPQEYDIWQLVDKTQSDYTEGFTENITVYNSSDVELTEGTDYKWNSTDGAIKFLNTSSTNDSAKANLTYVYVANTEAVQEAAGPLHVVTQALGRTGLLVGGLAIGLFLIALAGFIGQKLTNSGPRSNY